MRAADEPAGSRARRLAMPGGDQRFLSDPLVTGAQALPAPRGHYRPALDLAVSVSLPSARSCWARAAARCRWPRWCYMDALFEAYVRRSLERSAELENWAVQVLDGNKPFGRRYLFNDNTAHIAQPDVVLRVADGTTPLAGFGT